MKNFLSCILGKDIKIMFNLPRKLSFKFLKKLFNLSWKQLYQRPILHEKNFYEKKHEISVYIGTYKSFLDIISLTTGLKVNAQQKVRFFLWRTQLAFFWTLPVFHRTLFKKLTLKFIRSHIKKITEC